MLKLLLSYLKIGIIGFGGGSALIPVVEEEIVERRKLLSSQRYNQHVIISNITPGALPVKLGMLSGYDIRGIAGLLSGAFSVAFPGVFLTVVLLALLSVLGEGAVNEITYASIGICVFIIYLLFKYIKKVFSQSKDSNILLPAVAVTALSALVTCGKEIRQLSEVFFGETAFSKSTSIFDISTVNLLILAFFVIFFTGGNMKGIRLYISGAVCVLYVVLFGKTVNVSGTASVVIKTVMMAVAVFFMIRDVKKSGGSASHKPDLKALCLKLLAFLAVIAVSFVIAFIFAGNQIEYLLNGFVSTITSFGGGEAYLTVAEGIFVTSGKISSNAFYSQIIPVANALPGPILVKILSGIGYTIGFENFSVGAGFAMALLGFSVGVGATCMVCLVVDAIYSAFSSLKVFESLKLWILPIISGLLVTTVLSMMTESLKTAVSANMNSLLALAMMCAIYLLTVFLKKKMKMQDVLIIIIDGAISLLVMHLI